MGKEDHKEEVDKNHHQEDGHHETYKTFLEGEGRKDYGHLEEDQNKLHGKSLVNSLEDSVKRSAATKRRLAATRSNSEDSVKHSVDTESR